MNSSQPILYGASYSVYVRSVMLVLEAKDVSYSIEPVDIFATGGPPSTYLELHPFGRIPALVHGSFTVYETTAINRYIDEAFEGQSLQPAHPRERARMNQIVAITDAYGYRPLVWDIYVEQVAKPGEGKPSDEGVIQAAVPKARKYLNALSRLAGSYRFLVGDAPTLADFHVAPVFGCFLLAPEGQKLIREFPVLERWWEIVSPCLAKF